MPAPKTVKVEDELVTTEADRVFAWRYEIMLRAGLDDYEATRVASSSFDLHKAEEMLAAGCPPEVLVEIAR